ncbi:MAG: TSUP family transporter [Clostridia bacterium]|nr:TSUP family transporter [Clostridia bacterium]
MELTWVTYLIVCPLVFLAGLIDSVAGGGGLISLPAYLAAGLPPVLAAGTNKLSACLGTVASTTRFVREKKVDWKAAVFAAAGAFPGSWLGTLLLRQIPEDAVRLMMICAIPVVAAVVLRKREMQGRCLVEERFYRPLAFAIGLAIGFYDGLIGPGTGTFLILLFTMALGMEAVMASGTAKVVNLTSNLAALISLFSTGNVLIALGLPAALCGIAGNWVGAGLTIKKGVGFIRRMLLIVLCLLLAKMLLDVL